jgi:hypothetical protein
MVLAFFRARDLLFQKLSVLFVNDALIFVGQFCFDSFSFAFVIFGICVLQYFPL